MGIEAGKVRYFVYVATEGGETLNITKAVDDLSWEENEKEISGRITFRMYNAKYGQKKLSKLIKIGQAVTIKADWGAGKKHIATGYIKSAEQDTTKSSETYKIVAYDCLFAMQKSQDSIYYAAGKTTKALLSDIFSQWGVQIAEYTGPNVTHAKVVYKNKYISDIVLGILDEAVKKGGKKAVVRASKNQVAIVEKGGNTDVYEFTAKNCMEARYKVSIENMVTRVKIMAAVKKKDEQKVEAVVNGKTDYGILQRIQVHSQSDSLGDAKSAAQEILDSNGKPEETRTVQAPDVPPVRKGDKVSINAGSLKGEYIVKSVQHNAQGGKMSMEVVKR